MARPPASGQGRMAPLAVGGAMPAMSIALQDLRLVMILNTQSSVVHVRCCLQHTGFNPIKHQLSHTGVLSVMKERITMICHIQCMILIQHLMKTLMSLPAWDQVMAV